MSEEKKKKQEHFFWLLDRFNLGQVISFVHVIMPADAIRSFLSNGLMSGATSAAATPELATSQPPNRHAATAIERQRSQLSRLLRDPDKAAYIPPPPKEKTVRPAREMMKNVQGSSAGAGSGEFHVYKASRRREYERLKLMDEEAQQVRRLLSMLTTPKCT
jgi:hypothetical protein